MPAVVFYCSWVGGTAGRQCWHNNCFNNNVRYSPSCYYVAESSVLINVVLGASWLALVAQREINEDEREIARATSSEQLMWRYWKSVSSLHDPMSGVCTVV